MMIDGEIYIDETRSFMVLQESGGTIFTITPDCKILDKDDNDITNNDKAIADCVREWAAIWRQDDD